MLECHECIGLAVAVVATVPYDYFFFEELSFYTSMLFWAPTTRAASANASAWISRDLFEVAANIDSSWAKEMKFSGSLLA